MRKAVIMLGLLLGAVAAAAAAQTVQDGEQAWRQGDPAKAVAIWKPLAEKGDSHAAFDLGQAYRIGKGVPMNLGEAQRWLEVAARKGHIDAQATLGLMLFQSGNRVASVRWLKLAAEAGEPRAMLMYGTALFSGDGVAVDQVAAYAWVSRSAASGLIPAKSTLADLDAALSPEQREKGLAMAAAMTIRSPTKAETAPPRKVAQKIAPTKPAPVKPVAIQVPTEKSGNWRIQLGAFSQQGSAESLFAKVEPKLGGRQAYFVPVGKVIRLQAGPFATKAAATAACAAVKPTPCFPVVTP